MLISKIKYISLILISLLMLSSCSNLDIQKLNQKAVDLMNAGNVDGAIARLESINDLNPNFSQTNYNLGIAYHKKGEYEKAIATLNKAIKLKKDFADAYFSLGVIYEEMAVNTIDQSKKDEEENKKVTVNWASVVDNLKKSQEYYNQYLTIAKDAPDKDEILSKIKFLGNDIQKYQSMIPIANDNSMSQQ